MAQEADTRIRILRAIAQAGGLLREPPQLEGLSQEEILAALDELIILNLVQAKTNRGDDRLLSARDLVLTSAGVQQAAEPGAPTHSAGGDLVDSRAVFIVHGRDLEAKTALSSFLRDLDLRPIEWEELVAATGSAAPYTGDAVRIAFDLAQAVIILITPDDEARLHPDLHGHTEPIYERELTGQPRPNVLFEAGMALATHPDRSVLVEIGSIRPWSDVAGRNAVRLTGAAPALNALAQRLKNAGCPIKLEGSDWLNSSRFAELSALSRSPQANDAKDNGESVLPRGSVVGPPSVPFAGPRLVGRLLPHGSSGNYLLEIANRGNVLIENVEVLIPDEAHWNVMTEVLPEYPIKLLRARDHVRIPTSMSMSSAPVADIQLKGRQSSGEIYIAELRLSIYG